MATPAAPQSGTAAARLGLHPDGSRVRFAAVSKYLPLELTQPPVFKHAPLSQVELQERQLVLRKSHEQTLTEVESLVRQQQQVSTQLNGGIVQMRSKGTEFDKLDSGSQGGLLARITRLVSRRTDVLARRSISDALVQVHERTVLDLRRASAVADQLKRSAAELHQEVLGLFAERTQATQNLKLAAQRVLDLEAALDALHQDDSLMAAAKSQQVDSLEFVERSVSADVALIRAHVHLCTDEIKASRGLRDTVQTMHSDMSGFVMSAGKAVNSAGRKIQSLGMAADAATVVIELNESMEALDVALEETARYLLQADDLLTRVLPDLNARIAANDGVRRLSIETDLDQMSRTRAKTLADQALRAAADAEIDKLSEL